MKMCLAVAVALVLVVSTGGTVWGSMTLERTAAAADSRTVLHAPPRLLAHQRQMMRDHLAAVQEVVAAMAAGKYKEGARTAHERLGLTPEMKHMCYRFGPAFGAMGVAFHHDGDRLGEVLATGDPQKSLAALQKVLSDCVACHARFRS